MAGLLIAVLSSVVEQNQAKFLLIKMPEPGGRKKYSHF